MHCSVRTPTQAFAVNVGARCNTIDDSWPTDILSGGHGDAHVTTRRACANRYREESVTVALVVRRRNMSRPDQYDVTVDLEGLGPLGDVRHVQGWGGGLRRTEVPAGWYGRTRCHSAARSRWATSPFDATTCSSATTPSFTQLLRRGPGLSHRGHQATARLEQGALRAARLSTREDQRR